MTNNWILHSGVLSRFCLPLDPHSHSYVTRNTFAHSSALTPSPSLSYTHSLFHSLTHTNSLSYPHSLSLSPRSRAARARCSSPAPPRPSRALPRAHTSPSPSLARARWRSRSRASCIQRWVFGSISVCVFDYSYTNCCSVIIIILTYTNYYDSDQYCDF